MDFPLAQFRLLFPMFADMSDELVLAVADWARCYISERGCACTEKLWMLMTAHLLQLRMNATNGNGSQPGAIASATIDKVSVSFQAPTSTDGWSHWLNLTPFGQEFWALFKVCNSGGRYIGGNPERDAIRNVYGIRGGRRRWFR